MTRRDLFLGAVPALAGAQTEKPAAPGQPKICLFSQALARLDYTELGGILKAMGFDGCDLTVRRGGHVEPEKAPADLVRAIEGIRGEGVDVPIITTDLLSAAQPYARNVLGLAGQYMEVPYFRPGYWEYGPGAVEDRLAQVRRDFQGLVALGRAYGVAAGFHNRSGNWVGAPVWDIREMIAGLDPRWAGYCFDPCHATAAGGQGAWHLAMRMSLARVKMVAVGDFTWEKAGGRQTMKMCPLGEGVVDWPKFFSTLAAARFTGPVSLHLDYNPSDEAAAIARDLAFLRRQVTAAYGL